MFPALSVFPSKRVFVGLKDVAVSDAACGGGVLCLTSETGIPSRCAAAQHKELILQPRFRIHSKTQVPHASVGAKKHKQQACNGTNHT